MVAFCHRCIYNQYKLKIEENVMDWIRENWFFILFFIFFIWMHLSGHGCGGHGHGGDEHGKEEGRAL
jgi:hypothetical protein